MGRKGTAAIGRWGMAIIPAVPVLFAGLAKFTDQATWEANFIGWGLPAAMVAPIGALEIIAAVATLVPRTRFYGAALLMSIMLGAVITRWANGEWVESVIPFALAGIVSITGWWARPRWFHEMVSKMVPEAKEPEGPQSRRK